MVFICLILFYLFIFFIFFNIEIPILTKTAALSFLGDGVISRRIKRDDDHNIYEECREKPCEREEVQEWISFYDYKFDVVRSTNTKYEYSIDKYKKQEKKTKIKLRIIGFCCF